MNVNTLRQKSVSEFRRTDRQAEIRDWLVNHLAEELQLPLAEIDSTQPLTQYGISSMQAVSLSGDLEEWLDVSLSPMFAYEFPTLDAIAFHLAKLEEQTKQNSVERDRSAVDRSSATSWRQPMSLGQQRLWFLQQLSPEDVSYNEAISIDLDGDLDQRVFCDALADVVRAQDVLRTAFVDDDGQAVQLIRPQASLVVNTIELSNLPRRASHRVADNVARQLARTPFDLARTPLARISVLKLAPRLHRLIIVVHHLICDASSLEVFVRQLSQAYNARLRNAAPQIPPTQTSYGDHATWQRKQLEQGAYDSQANFWNRQLESPVSAVALPTGASREQENSTRGTIERFTLPSSLVSSLTELSIAQNVTKFMTFLAAFKTLLFRYTGQADQLVGTTVADRHHIQVRDLIGFFANTLPLRTDLSHDPRFNELLERVRTTCLEAFAHQAYPFEQIARNLRSDAGLAARLPNVAFTYLNRASQFQLDGLVETNRSTIHTGTSKFDLSLIIQEEKEAASGIIEYRTDLFTADQIRRLITHFTEILRCAAVNPESHLSEITILSDDEFRQTRQSWLATTVEHPVGCLHERFEAQVAKTPHAIAVCFEDQHLSYAELNAQAEQLAAELQQLGAGPERLVPLCLERSTDMVVGILGVLKAGATYVPICPSYPSARIHQIVAQTQPQIVLTHSSHRHKLQGISVPTHCLDQRCNSAAFGKRRRPTTVNVDNPAYVIFTSGSTGTPKGVVITHRAICNHMLWMQSDYPLSPQDRVLQKTPFGFDASVWEFYAPLFVGGCLVVARPDGHLDADYLLRTIRQQGISTLQLVPSMLKLILDAELDTNCPTLRRLFCGGEALPSELVHRWRHRSDAQIVNLYGPTETTIDASHHVFDFASDQQPIVPIGRAIDNHWISVRDNSGNVLPTEVVGELTIGGVGLARGYVGCPDLTAERFVPDAFSETVGARVYRTGDTAKVRPDGRVDYLGRMDYQIKLHGHRIELTEIDLALKSYPQVHDAIVDVCEHQQSKTLVAYVVAASDCDPLDTSALRRHVSQQLPDYMVPTVFVPIKSMPLASSGKLDRRALPAPDFCSRSMLTSRFAKAETRKELVLAEIWQDVLGVDRVGIDDSFFELGGDSILSLQVLAKANRAGLSLTPKQLMEQPTIRSLAATAGEATPVSAEQGVVVGESPLTPIQEWFFEQKFDQPDHWNQSILLRLDGDPDVASLDEAMARLVAHHDVLRSSFQHRPGSQTDWQQLQSSPKVDSMLRRVELTETDVSEREARIKEIAGREQAGLRLEDGIVFRGVLFDVGDSAAKLLLIAHHLVVDGVSWRILIEDLQSLYSGLRKNQPLELPPKTTSYQHWAARLNDHANSDEIIGDADLWLQQTPSLADPPVDIHNGENTEAVAGRVTVKLTVDETDALLRDVPSAYHTEVNDVLLTAVSRTLCDWMQSSEVTINLEGHGREGLFSDVDLSRTVGWFTTLFPATIQVDERATLGDAIKSTKRQLREIPQCGLPFGLMRYLRRQPGCEIRSRLEALPTAAFSFNYLGQIDQVLGGEAEFTLEKLSMGNERASDAKRPHLIDVVAIVRQGRLEFEWTFSQQRHLPSTIEQLAADCLQTLRQLIEHCDSTDELAYTADEFSDFDWNDDDLANVVAEINKSTSA